jgi:outer membrane protein OmpA-like peptidoglycan-associated protein
MFGMKTPKRKGGKDEAEKPFWISFSDLMTALMVLFLVAMSVALMSVTQGLANIEQLEKERKDGIASCVEDMSAASVKAGASMRKHPSRYAIEFGTLVEYGHNEHNLNPQSDRFIRSFVPKVLDVAREGKCKTWLKRIVVEGFASQSGGYLYNLNLSYLRSQRVLCTLLSTTVPDRLDETYRREIQTLFLVGGSSFNTVQTQNPAQMQRVELKLEFLDAPKDGDAKVGNIPLDPGDKCPNP